jgi:hypothetical protein
MVCFSRKGGVAVIALSANFLAFYLGSIFIERSGIFCGVTVFLLTALAGTIVASKLEKCLSSLISGAFNRSGDNKARQSAHKPYIDVVELIPHPVRTYDNY